MELLIKRFSPRLRASAVNQSVRIGSAILLCCLVSGMQDGKKVTDAQSAKPTQGHMASDEKKVEVVPITEEHHHHLVLDNEYVRVFYVEVAPHAETLYHQHDMDYVFVTLGDSVVESVRVGEKPVKLELKDGDTRVTKGGFAHKAVNLSDKPFVNVTVELKKDVGLVGCEPCIDNTITKSTDSSRVYRTEILSSDKGVVYKWNLSGKFEQLTDVSMPRDFLMVPLTNFKLGGDKHPYKVGEAIWRSAGTYYWGAKSGASFVTIEIGPCVMGRDVKSGIAPC